jgi:hypothetical protein
MAADVPLGLIHSILGPRLHLTPRTVNRRSAELPRNRQRRSRFSVAAQQQILTKKGNPERGYASRWRRAFEREQAATTHDPAEQFVRGNECNSATHADCVAATPDCDRRHAKRSS